MPIHVEASDFLTIGALVLLEAVLSADNAMVLAVLVLPLPPALQKRALRYGIAGAFILRILATLFAVYLISWSWIKLVGGVYLLYLPWKHFRSRPDEVTRGSIRPATAILGLSLFWSTVVRVEMTDFVFAIDSILVAVAMSPKAWVVISGGILGIIAMRLLIGQVLGLVRSYPAVVDGAYVIVAWVGVKLLLEFSHVIGWIEFVIPKWLSVTVMLLLFAATAVYARMKHRPGVANAAEETQDLVEP
jgi:YkoY family integral membrane protein